MENIETPITPVLKTEIPIICPECKQKFNFTMYPLIDLQKDTDLYEQLFSLAIFKPICPKCGKTHVIQYGTLIIDRYKKYMVYLYNPEMLDDFNKEIKKYIEHLKESKNQAIMEVLNGLKHTRVVTSANDLIEKLLIYDYDLNDKIIELLKQGLIENKLIDEKECQSIMFNKIDGDKLSFSCIKKDDIQNITIQEITVKLDYYNHLIDSLGTAVNEISETDFPLINNQWAKNIITLTRNNSNEQTH